MGQPAGEEDPQEAPRTRTVCTLLAPGVRQGPAQPVHEEAQSTAAHQQEQVGSGWAGPHSADRFQDPLQLSGQKKQVVGNMDGRMLRMLRQIAETS